MIRKLPRWVEYSAFLLSVLAGSVNVIGLISFDHQAISHVSGTVSRLGADLLVNPTSSLHLLFVLLSFLCGAILSGILIENTTLKIGRHYGSALMIESFLLLIAFATLRQNLSLGSYFTSMACGLQNALFTTFSGATLRTTHVTGIFTDLGLMIGQRIKGQPFDRRKASLFLLILAGFIVGSIIGSWLFSVYLFNALLFPILLCCLLAFSYSLFYKHL
ncbi:YoaK family protein [Psychromonas sp. Urea-02u-13]|uniref:YoaK family protein n=1 Tax=Psychromonas sp. Urea-02u-13 TaxID=2058326 RepID=UPI000C342F14|nr:YoaK family protein [Psychromonas sp. Urea-02u-13]PKG40146.1 DUF1275 domain-containing protein [Psychromonas sp. Urea-02u-13]